MLLVCLAACSHQPQKTVKHSFITVNDSGQFIRDGKPYYFVGTNFWYGAILGSTGRGGDRDRLARELDFLKSIGVTNLRTLVGADGPDGIKTRVEPSLQLAPGVYNDTILDGLDYFMNELKKMAEDAKITFKEEEYNRSLPLIQLQIKALIARDLYDMTEYFYIINDVNDSYQKALRILNDEERYHKIVGVKQ